MSEEQNNKSLYPESVSFDEDKLTLLLHINEDIIDFGGISRIAAQNGFDKKTEFHITVTGYKAGAEMKQILDKLSGERRQETLRKIRSLVKNTTWGFTLLPQRYHVKKDYTFRTGAASSSERRESYIQMVSMPDMEKFSDALNNILGTSFEPPPPHLTLYTNGDNRERAKAGIGINSQEEFLKLNPQLVVL